MLCCISFRFVPLIELIEMNLNKLVARNLESTPNQLDLFPQYARSLASSLTSVIIIHSSLTRLEACLLIPNPNLRPKYVFNFEAHDDVVVLHYVKPLRTICARANKRHEWNSKQQHITWRTKQKYYCLKETPNYQSTWAMNFEKWLEKAAQKL